MIAEKKVTLIRKAKIKLRKRKAPAYREGNWRYCDEASAATAGLKKPKPMALGATNQIYNLVTLTIEQT